MRGGRWCDRVTYIREDGLVNKTAGKYDHPSIFIDHPSIFIATTPIATLRQNTYQPSNQYKNDCLQFFGQNSVNEDGNGWKWSI